MTPISSASNSVPWAIARSASRVENVPSTTRTNATTPRYWSYDESKTSARAGASGSPAGDGIRSTIASRTSSTPTPVFAEMRSTRSGSSPSRSPSSFAAPSGSACGRSILFAAGTISSPPSIARYAFASVCASIPCAASTTSSAPSQACSERDTSYVKSTCPGVSMRFSWCPFQDTRTACALIVIPRSRSSSIESRSCSRISRSETAPVSSRMRSASVDLPWSMCAMIAKLRLRSCCIGLSALVSRSVAVRSQQSQRLELAKSEHAGECDVHETGHREPRPERHELCEQAFPKPRVEPVPRCVREPGRDRPGDRDANDDAERPLDVLESDAPAHHHEQHGRRDDVHGRRRERDAPDAEPVEERVEEGVEADRAQRDPGRQPGRLHRVEAAVEDQEPAVEEEPDRERLQALRDDHGVLRRELAALVDELDDRLREHDRHERRRNEQECDLAQAAVERAPQPAHVVPCSESCERREEHRGDGDREDPLREHVQAERLVDRRRREL